jgi:hypothetical protein
MNLSLGIVRYFLCIQVPTVQGQKIYLSKRCNMTIDRLLPSVPKNFPSIFMTINEKQLQNDEAEKTYTRIYKCFIVPLVYDIQIGGWILSFCQYL